MKLEEIKEVEVSSDKEEVNKLLINGYKITKILSTKVRTNEYECIQPTFVLGRD